MEEIEALPRAKPPAPEWGKAFARLLEFEAARAPEAGTRRNGTSRRAAGAGAVAVPDAKSVAELTAAVAESYAAVANELTAAPMAASLWRWL